MKNITKLFRCQLGVQQCFGVVYHECPTKINPSLALLIHDIPRRIHCCNPFNNDKIKFYFYLRGYEHNHENDIIIVHRVILLNET